MELRELNRLFEMIEKRIETTLKGIPAYLLNNKHEEAKRESEKYLKLNEFKETLNTIDLSLSESWEKVSEIKHSLINNKF